MRSLDDHLSPEELSRLPEDLDLLEHEDSEEPLLEHLKICDACMQLARTLGKLHKLGPPDHLDDEECPFELAWLELAQGLCPDRAEQMLKHASRCGTCARLLREATELMQPEEAEQPMPSLKSSTAVWQRRMASRMASHGAAPATDSERIGFLRKFNRRRIWPIASLSLASALVAVLTAVLILRMRSPSDAKLLALAYNQQRRIELRIPGGDPVPIASEIRGDNDDLRAPVPLLDLQTRAERHLAKTPGDAYWNQRLGEVYLLERKGRAAANSFTNAKTANPNLSGLTADLAASSYEMYRYPEPGKVSDAKDLDEYLVDAIHQYNQALESSTVQRSILYYNLAQCLVEAGLRDEAEKDLLLALSSETSPEWRKAIQVEIDRLNGKSSFSDGLDSFSSAQSAGPGPITEDSYEARLDEATGQWLTQWRREPAIRDQIDQLARLGLRHNDRWIHDWATATHSEATELADRQLAAAVQEASAGDESASLVNSQKALAAYSASGNLPGRIRAQLAAVYAFQRLGKTSECLAGANSLEREPQVAGYAWVRTQLTLEKANCNFLTGNYESASRGYDQAVKQSVSYGLGWLYARAIGGQAEILDLRGSPRGALRIDTEMLRLCNRIQCPPIRKYTLVYDMMHSAEQLDLKYAALEMMDAGVPLAEASGDATTYAYALETLATLAGRLGDYATSDRAFAAALQVSTSGKPIGDVDIYRAEWQTDRAEILLRRGASREALALLQQSRQALLGSEYQHGILHYYSDMALAGLATGDLTQARTSALDAVHQVDITLRSLHSVDKKEQWQRESASEFAQLVKVYLGLKDDQKAFETWEYYRSLAYQDPRPINNGAPLSLPAVPVLAGKLGEQPVVVLARVDDDYIGWIVAPGANPVLETVDLGGSAQIRQLASTFYHLCSDRDSDLSDIRAVGERLFTLLLKPLYGKLGPHHRILLDVDSSLGSIPFSAMTLPNGRWLGDELSISILPPWWSLHREILGDDTPIPNASRVMVLNGFSKAEGDYSEAAQVALMFPHAALFDGSVFTSQALLKNVSASDVFHFSGHARSDAGSNDLLLTASRGSGEKIDTQIISAYPLQHLRIAVLAACNPTASNPDIPEPSPDGRNAFLRAGAHGVIASNWDVDDHSTGVLMLSFYRQLMSGLSPAQSLQLAESTLRSQTNWQHPYYWASFQYFVN